MMTQTTKAINDDNFRLICWNGCLERLIVGNIFHFIFYEEKDIHSLFSLISSHFI